MKIKPKKSLGQNFLRDNTFIEKILTRANLSNAAEIIEIGPGDGALTKYLANTNKKFRGFEIDNQLHSKLNTKFSDYKNMEFINADILEVDLRKFSSESLIVFGNLPYNISSQIILKILEEDFVFLECIFLVQKEMAERFISKKVKQNKLSLIAEYFGSIHGIFDIPPEAFHPKPKVTSTLIRLVKNNKDRELNYLNFKMILTKCFANPRKKIKAGLKTLNLEMDSFSFDINKRPEELVLDDFFEILRAYEQQI
jgi:16S rRNA (adenine1518-N6/adenine1519-N6)-dimethyltransferase